MGQVVDRLKELGLFSEALKQRIKNIFLSQPQYISNIAHSLKHKFFKDLDLTRAAKVFNNILQLPRYSVSLGKVYACIFTSNYLTPDINENLPENWRAVLLAELQQYGGEIALLLQNAQFTLG